MFHFLNRKFQMHPQRSFCSVKRRFLLCVLILAPLRSTAAHRYDVVVYGGTAGGVVTAVSAAREGMSVALLEPGNHLGGMVSGGLGSTDYGKKDVIGGISREFFRRVGRVYHQDIAWYFEPHVAEMVFREMAREAKVDVFFAHRLKEGQGVTKHGTDIVEIHSEDGTAFCAKIFVDCSYEGDLMAQSGVTYTIGREGRAHYRESLAGVRPKDDGHSFEIPISARGEDGSLLPEISARPRGAIGSADHKVQAYNFRMCLSKDKTNQIPFSKPAGYDPQRYRLLALWLQGLAKSAGHGPSLNEIMIVSPMPNQKTDVNNRGAFSTDYIGKNWDYPDASYQRRAEIWQEHVLYLRGYFYFLANDPSVPADTQKAFNEYALARDEFPDTDHWPHQLYVREARRMVGDFVMTQKDIQEELLKSDVIGMGSYNSDSHNVQRYVESDGTVQNEGNMEVPVKPYQIPYRIMLPKKQEVTNLLVPVCFSASHVAFSTGRMEPQYMILGEAAGVAAKMAIASGKSVQDMDGSRLRPKLLQRRVVLDLQSTASDQRRARKN